MGYYVIRFKVEREKGFSYRFISGYLFKSKEKALEHAKEFASKCAEEDETIYYELEQLIVAEP